MSDIKFLEEHNKALHISGVRCSILSPIDWIKKVQGVEHLNYLDEDDVTLAWTTQLMEWYGDYVGRKVKKYYT